MSEPGAVATGYAPQHCELKIEKCKLTIACLVEDG